MKVFKLNRKRLSLPGRRSCVLVQRCKKKVCKTVFGWRQRASWWPALPRLHAWADGSAQDGTRRTDGSFVLRRVRCREIKPRSSNLRRLRLQRLHLWAARLARGSRFATSRASGWPSPPAPQTHTERRPLSSHSPLTEFQRKDIKITDPQESFTLKRKGGATQLSTKYDF